MPGLCLIVWVNGALSEAASPAAASAGSAAMVWLRRAAGSPSVFDNRLRRQRNLAGRFRRAALRAGGIGGIPSVGGNQGLKICITSAADIFIQGHGKAPFQEFT